jgi:hypothetical protein
MEKPIDDWEKIEIKCIQWLKDKFEIDAEIVSMKPQNQEEVDSNLGLLGIKFDFKTKEGQIGDSVAFFKLEEIDCPEIYKYTDRQLRMEGENANQSSPSNLLDERIGVGSY